MRSGPQGKRVGRREFEGSSTGPVAKFENGREVGRVGPHFTTAIRGPPSLKAEPIRPFLALLTNFATGPSADRSVGHDAPASAPATPFDATELRVRNAQLEARIAALETILENERRRAEEIRVERDRWAEQAQTTQRLLSDQRQRPRLLARLFRHA